MFMSFDDELDIALALADDKTTRKDPSYNCRRGMLCPTCDKALWTQVEIKGVFGTKKITIKEEPNFCKYCGQALSSI